jgi:signal peptidase II|tara:strand:- start:4424 stop:4918 length:495 start_codon:yes stop_codon:yes gene_type:complete
MPRVIRNNLISLIFVVAIFLVDRLTKIYILNLSEGGTEVDFYIFSFLNIYLVWNSGIGFGLFSVEPNLFYNFITFLIIVINFILIYLLIKSSTKKSFLFTLILGGSLGNMYDRLYYFAVPDFIDFHLGDFHWFIFNVADIFITIGIIGLIIFELLGSNFDEKKN